MPDTDQTQSSSGFLKRVIHFNKHYLNHLTLKIARSNHGPFAIVVHTGRRSGKIYETPVIVRAIPDGFVFALTYGTWVDWYKNILASGKCKLILHGSEYLLHSPQTISAQEGIDSFPLPFNVILKAMKKELFFKMIIENKNSAA